MEKEKKKLTGKRVFLYFCIFFGIIIIVNTLFIRVALKTNPGVDVEHTYEKEMKLNKNNE